MHTSIRANWKTPKRGFSICAAEYVWEMYVQGSKMLRAYYGAQRQNTRSVYCSRRERSLPAEPPISSVTIPIMKYIIGAGTGLSYGVGVYLLIYAIEVVPTQVFGIAGYEGYFMGGILLTLGLLIAPVVAIVAFVVIITKSS